MNEDGTLIVANADANDNNTDKQHQTDKMNEQSDRLMLVEQKAKINNSQQELHQQFGQTIFDGIEMQKVNQK